MERRPLTSFGIRVN